MENMYSYSYGNDDVYCYKDSNVLKNKFGITDWDELQELERNITSLKEQLVLDNKKDVLDFKFLKKIHKTLFSDVYSWAGKVRTVDIAKGTLFCRVFAIEEEAAKVFEELKNERYLMDCSEQDLPKRLAYYISEINAIHPFREGNGRAQRIFMSVLAERIGYHLDFTGITDTEMIEASYSAFMRNYSKMEEIFQRVVNKIGDE